MGKWRGRGREKREYDWPSVFFFLQLGHAMPIKRRKGGTAWLGKKARDDGEITEAGKKEKGIIHIRRVGLVADAIPHRVPRAGRCEARAPRVEASLEPGTPIIHELSRVVARSRRRGAHGKKNPETIIKKNKNTRPPQQVRTRKNTPYTKQKHKHTRKTEGGSAPRVLCG